MVDNDGFLHFPDIIRIEMQRMNPRQRLTFSKKVYQCLMDTFEDPKDFPQAVVRAQPLPNSPQGRVIYSRPPENTQVTFTLGQQSANNSVRQKATSICGTKPRTQRNPITMNTNRINSRSALRLAVINKPEGSLDKSTSTLNSTASSTASTLRAKVDAVQPTIRVISDDALFWSPQQ